MHSNKRDYEKNFVICINSLNPFRPKVCLSSDEFKNMVPKYPQRKRNCYIGSTKCKKPIRPFIQST
jgi:hypothetical protein